MASVFQAPQRPRITSKITFAAAQVIAGRLSGVGTKEAITAEDLVNNYDPDGIDFANNLRTNTQADIDARDVSILDDMDAEAWLLLAKEGREWVKANDIQPVYREGDHVMAKHPTLKVVMKAVVKSINGADNREISPGTYVVEFPEANELERWILPYEEVELQSK